MAEQNTKPFDWNETGLEIIKLLEKYDIEAPWTDDADKNRLILAHKITDMFHNTLASQRHQLKQQVLEEIEKSDDGQDCGKKSTLLALTERIEAVFQEKEV